MPFKTDRYVIVTEPRSGSHLLQEVLNSHKDIECGNEVFNVFLRVSEEEKDIQRAASNGDFSKIVPFNRSIKLEKKPEALHGGFILHGKQITDQILEMLKEVDARILFLNRINLLERYVSEKIARTIHVYEYDEINERYNSITFTLTMNELCADFERIMKRRETLKGYFKEHKCLIVTYESLDREFRAAVESISRFFNVEKLFRPPLAKKMQRRKMGGIIQNYSELKEKFKNSKWETFFNE